MFEQTLVEFILDNALFIGALIHLFLLFTLFIENNKIKAK
jgi:hypothetical protein